MASADNRLRRKWQHYSGRNAGVAENDFYEAFCQLFEDTEFVIRANPNEFSKIYVDVELSEKVKSEIYNPPNPITKHGVFPDYAIRFQEKLFISRLNAKMDGLKVVSDQMAEAMHTNVRANFSPQGF